MRNLICVYFLRLLAIISVASGQRPFYFDHISNNEGLSENSIYDIIQDRVGYMWFATHDGLNRYDGYTITVYQNDPMDSTSISHNVINCLLEDSKGNLWIGTDGGGLNKYDRDHDNFRRFLNDESDTTSIADNTVWDIIEDHKAQLWLATQKGLEYFNPADENKFVHNEYNSEDSSSISDNIVFKVFEDDEGVLWIGTRKGLDRYDRIRKRFIHCKASPEHGSKPFLDNVFSIYQDNQKLVWIGTLGRGLYRLDKKNNGFVRYTNDPLKTAGLSNDFIWDIKETADGDLCVATDAGLNVYHRDSNKFTAVHHDPEDKSTLGNDIVKSIYLDRNDRLWVGCQFGGVNIYDRLKNQFINYRYVRSSPNHLSHNNVTAVAEDSEGNLWIATDAGGLNHFDRHNNRFTCYRHDPKNSNSIASNKILTLLLDNKDNLWIGFWADGADYYDRKTGKFFHYRHKEKEKSSLDGNNVLHIFEDSKNRIWFGTLSGGLNLLENSAIKKIKHYRSSPDDEHSLSGGKINFIYEDSGQNIWVATSTGFCRFDEKQQNFYRYDYNPADTAGLSDNFVQFIYEDSKKRFWIGTTRGLDLFDRESGSFRHFNMKDGFPNNMFHSMLEDDHGNLWLSTNKGLTKFDPVSLACKNYDIRDGLQNNQFNTNSCVKTRRGELVFGGINGFNLFHPDSIKTNQTPPPVVFTNLQIANETVHAGYPGSPLQNHISRTKRLILSYRQSPFKLTFAALNYTIPEKNCYRYRLLGFDTRFNNIGTVRNVTFMNLDPGDYTLQVQACNNDGLWNLKPASIDITILPPFWYRWWFRLAILLSAVFLVVVLFRFRTRSIRKRSELLDQLVKKRTQQLEQANKELEAFTYSVSHDLRAPLRSISGFSHILAEENTNHLDENGRNVLTRIQSATNYMTQLIEDLLKLSRISLSDTRYKNVNLSQLVNDILEEYLDAQPHLKETVIIENNLFVSGDERLLRIMLNNLIGNAIKFTGKSIKPHIEFGELKFNRIKPSLRGKKRVFFVADNGVGFDKQFVSKIFDPFQRLHAASEFEGTGIGLAIVRRIVNKHGGEIWADSEIDKGATLYFTLS